MQSKKMPGFIVTVIYGEVENAEVRKPKYGNRSSETEVRKWEEKRVTALHLMISWLYTRSINITTGLLG